MNILNRQERKAKIEDLLKIIAGLEISIRHALDDKDWDTLKDFRKYQISYYKKLRDTMYGLETRKEGAKE